MFSGTRSPSLEAMYRKRPSFTRPPVRAINSPRLTEEEADQLTSPFLNYSTGYTYAFSQAYNPDKPPAWEVPNINNNLLHISNPEYVPYHFSAPSVLNSFAQKGISVIHTLLNALYWLLHLVTVRLSKAIALLLYELLESVLCMIRTAGECVSVVVYNITSNHSSRRSYSSVREILSVALTRLVNFIVKILRAPVDLVVCSFYNFRSALRRSYYEILEEKSREIDRKAILSKLEEIKQLEAEARRFLANIEARKAARERGEVVGELEIPFVGIGHKYNLRRRRPINADTDSEDDIPQRQSVDLDKQSQAKSHKAYRVASWLGSVASSSVYYVLYMIHLLILSAWKSYDNLCRAFSFISSSAANTSSSSFWPNARHGAGRSNLEEAYVTRREISVNSQRTEQTSTRIFAQFKSVCHSVLYVPIRAFLFAVFAVADILHWMYSIIANFGWMRSVSGNIGGLLGRRFRCFWLLFPLLLLLFLLTYRVGNERLVSLGHDVSEMKEQLSNYVYTFIDPDAVHVKSLNSIYDEYWKSGKLSRYGVLSRISATATNIYLLVTTTLSTMADIFYTSVKDLLSCVLDFFATYGRGTYSALPTISRLPNLSEILDISTTQMSQYFPTAPNLTSWSSSAVSVFTSTGQHFRNGLVLLSDFGNTIFTGLVKSFFLVWNGVFALIDIIGNSFHRTSSDFENQQTDVKLRASTEVRSDAVCVPSYTSAIDEDRLVDKITAVVRAQMDHDLKVKLEQELKALSATYDEKFSKLELDKSRHDVDYSLLESVIRTAIHEYDSDKTGMFDFALESAGASIISTRCSENYNTYSRLEKIWNIPLWYSSYGPRTVIQRNSKTLFPGECWSFKGSVGYITIGLSHAINVTLVSYEHIGAHQAPGSQRPSAPKTFKIWAYKSEDDMSTRVLLGDFIYDLKGSPLQFFVVKAQPDYPVKIIEMEVTSNYGADYTSLYRLRVHGSLYNSGKE